MEVTWHPAPGKLNLFLHVLGRRPDGYHELQTVFRLIDRADRVGVAVRPDGELRFAGDFGEDNLCLKAARLLKRQTGARLGADLRLEKNLPVGGGLGGGSSDAATVLLVLNRLWETDLSRKDLLELGLRLGADVPFFLYDRPQLATGDGSVLEPVVLPTDYHVVLVIPTGEQKASTGSVYDAFDARGGGADFGVRSRGFRQAAATISRPSDLGSLALNDLARRPLADRLISHGAFRADVSGAGPTVYGLFERKRDADAAADALGDAGRTIVTAPVAR